MMSGVRKKWNRFNLGLTMPIKPIDRQKLISEYLDAFRFANPGMRAPIVGYVKPFYRFKIKEKTPWEPKKYRHRDMQRMIKALLDRPPLTN